MEEQQLMTKADILSLVVAFLVVRMCLEDVFKDMDVSADTMDTVALAKVVQEFQEGDR